MTISLLRKISAIIVVCISIQGFVFCAEDSGKITIAVDSKTEYKIIQTKDATEPEKFAVKELATFLKRVTGAEFPVIIENNTKITRGIYVGWTDFSKKSDINETLLGEEEFIVKTVGKDLILTGGRPRGTMYAVYEFLEWQIGCHWLDQYVEVVPSKKTLEISQLDIKRKPQFDIRHISSGTGTPDRKWEFMIRNKNFRYDFRGRKKGTFYPQGAFYKMYGTGSHVHNFSYYVNAKDWFETHPEYFSLGSDGKRIPAYDGRGPGQLCLTNPDVLQIVLEKMRSDIKSDREEAAKKGIPYPKYYRFNQNDKYHAHCQCSDCQAIAKREGSESGPLINFLNLLTKGLEKDYPDILVGTLAYNMTSKPPKYIRPKKNVLIDWCDVYSHVDLSRPLTDPLNTQNHNEIKGWSEISPSLGIGDDYWTSLSYYRSFPAPYSIIHSIAADIKLFADLGCKTFFCENGEYMNPGQNFKMMKMWLGYKMLDNPYIPAEKLIKIFMDGYYGPASGKMQEFMAYQKKRILADGQYMMVRNEPHKLAYLDLEFFQTTEKLFDEAIAAVEKDSVYYKNINDERLILDGALLFMWPWLEMKLPGEEKLPFDKNTVIDRYGYEWRDYRHYNIFYSFEKNSPSATMYYSRKYSMVDIMCDLFRNPKIPEQFKDIPEKDIADFNWLTFSQIRPRQEFIDDEDALGKMTAKSGKITSIMAAEADGDKLAKQYGDNVFSGTLDFGADGIKTTVLSKEKIPQDEKYHLYKVGRITVTNKTMVWAFNRRLGVNVDRIYNPAAEDPTKNIWTAYISLKVTGPAYVKNSRKENNVFMDRVILVRLQKDEKLTPEEKKAIEESRIQIKSAPVVSVPEVPCSAKINWSKAVLSNDWFTIPGHKSKRNVSAKFLYDKNFLHIRLEEKMDTSKITNSDDIFHGDDWEILFSAKKGAYPYRQLAVNPAGKIKELAYGEGAWQSEVKVESKILDNAWQVTLSFPLAKITAKDVKKGDDIFLNILRGGKENLVWSPVYGERFHSLVRFGKLILK